jgi:hypothetical protein
LAGRAALPAGIEDFAGFADYWLAGGTIGREIGRNGRPEIRLQS